MKRIVMGLNASRRRFLKNAIVGASAAGAARLFADEHHARLTKGDAALLRFAAAAEILESDFWIQYNELGGIQDNELSGGSGNPTYTAKLQTLDSDFSQYIHDNTDDEVTHFTFLNAYLQSKGATPVNLGQFRTLPGSTATGSSRKPGSQISRSSLWIPVGGPDIGAVRTIQTWILILSFHRQCRI